MIGIGSDHNGFELKERLCAYLAECGEKVADFGVRSGESVDYPDIAAAVARAVNSGLIDRGILVCGSGIGMAIAANKIRGIRAASINDLYSARLARERNDAQIIALGANLVGPGLACAIVKAWLEAEFRGGESTRKLEKIRALEQHPRLRLISTLAAGGRPWRQ